MKPKLRYRSRTGQWFWCYDIWNGPLAPSERFIVGPLTAAQAFHNAKCFYG